MLEKVGCRLGDGPATLLRLSSQPAVATPAATSKSDTNRWTRMGLLIDTVVAAQQASAVPAELVEIRPFRDRASGDFTEGVTGYPLRKARERQSMRYLAR